MLSALSIGPFEVTRLRLAGDTASYRYGFSKLRGCHGEGLRSVNTIVRGMRRALKGCSEIVNPHV